MRLEVIKTETEQYIHYIIHVVEPTVAKLTASLNHWIDYFLPEGREAGLWRYIPDIVETRTDGGAIAYEGRARFSVRKT